MLIRHRLASGGVTLLALSLLGCSSAKKRADEAFLAGDFEKASELYLEATRDDQRDLEASAGLRKSRAQLLSQQLIGVRNARMGGNLDAAVEQLSKIFDLEKQWEIQPGGNASFTQEEEVDLLSKFFSTKVQGELSVGYPLRAQVMVKRYGHVFPLRVVQALRTEVIEEGKKSCEKLKGQVESDTPFFAQFVSQYCEYWGTVYKISAEQKQGLKAILYQQIHLQNRPDGLSPEVYSNLLQGIQKTFRSSPWFDSLGQKSASGSFSGNLTVEKSKQGTVLVQNYFEPEKYVEQVKVNRTRQVPYSTTEQVYDPVSKQLVSKQITQYRTETYQDVEPVERTRQIQRSYRYPAWKHTQTLQLFVSADFKFGEDQIHSKIQEQDTSDGIEHDEDQPAYGLRPSQPRLRDPIRWSADCLGKLVEDFRVRSNELWDQTYCKTSSETEGGAASAEQAQLCLRAHPYGTAPAIVESWYKEKLGLSVSDAQAVLKGSR